MDVGYLRSRIARRLFVLFVACALIPIGIATLLTTGELNALSQQRANERLGDLARTQGMAFVGRLLAADDVVRALMGTDALASARPERGSLGAVLADLRESPASPTASTGRAPGEVPPATPSQRQALEQGLAVLLFQANGALSADAFLLYQASAGHIVSGRLNSASLWPDPSDLPEGVRVAVVDSQLGLLNGTAPLSSAMRQALRQAMSSGKSRDRASGSIRWQDASGAWRGQYWQSFLGGHFAAPSLYIVTYSPALPFYREFPRAGIGFPAIIALAAVAVLWLSMAQIRRQLRPLEHLIAGTRRLARRDFAAVEIEATNDEIGELARSFNDMGTSLKRQFHALASMAEIDRLLLRSPDLEGVLDHLLPRLAEILRARTTSVMLFDRDAPGRARLYDYVSEQSGVRPVRRVEVDPEDVHDACPSAGTTIRAEQAQFAAFGFLAPMVEAGSSSFQLQLISLSDHIAGMLCVGFAASAPEDVAQQARDFADRLGVVLANLNDRAQLYRQAHYDPLTGLANRALFHERLAEAMRRALDAGGRGALLYIDLDHFKRVNDSAGHKTGDSLLQVVARRLSACVGEGDTVARLGGDEFAIVLRELADPVVARTVCMRILELLANPIFVGGRDQFVSASIGVAVFPDDGTSAEELLTHSDVAMYRAKDSGRSQAVYFEQEMYAQILRKSTLDSDLHRAVHARQFRVHYQPIVRCRDRRLVSAEALIRWPGASGSLTRSPAEFIPAAEDNGLIVEIGALVLDTALRDFASWLRADISLEYVSVNVSPRQLRDPGFVRRVEALLQKHAIHPRFLQIEITESVLGEGAQIQAVLRRLATIGVRLAIDDFGTGYSSLSYLRDFPIDSVKIDRSFIEDVPAKRSASRLVETIVLMGRSLEKKVVAEGVETEEQLEFLNARECDMAQGFLFGKPMAADAFAFMAGGIEGPLSVRTGS